MAAITSPSEQNRRIISDMNLSMGVKLRPADLLLVSLVAFEKLRRSTNWHQRTWGTVFWKDDLHYVVFGPQ